jgi:hypothetical protein
VTMTDDWRELHRHPGQPDIKVGDMISGMEKGADGNWRGIVAPVEAVELLSTEPNGSRVFGVNLGQSVPCQPPDSQCH